MKHCLFGSIAFLVTLSIGVLAVSFFPSGPLSSDTTASLEDSRNALFLLSDNGIPDLVPVNTLNVARCNSNIPDDNTFSDGLRIGDKRTFRLGDKNYVIRVIQGTSSQFSHPADLLLEYAGHKQFIWWGNANDDLELCELKWVGDLDGEGKLDLILAYLERDEIGEVVGGRGEALFLSSHAKAGKLVGPAAFSSDCHEPKLQTAANDDRGVCIAFRPIVCR
jgi:hypothetical protein